jgi:hypothetical protein
MKAERQLSVMVRDLSGMLLRSSISARHGASRAQPRVGTAGHGPRIEASHRGKLTMALVVFRSKAAGEIFMFAETARRLFEIIGRQESPRGVITAEQVPEALQKLVAAVEEEKAQLKAAGEQADLQDKEGDGTVRPRPITLGQRAFPLIEMLREAQKKKVDVTWGI